ncbi:hypothetical protein PCC7418_2667 [Halothece sp. PCC 7418]|uniref:hypothetical protein n=1 Tax=Halothece sp. (strain PCC 7418) TaxID=65093 RepID=UPI0002A07F85|nr:hypothetical protein [Halothece sp. PCC 7418]AFZ44806.1 hypothetical protein PCC7418_2667 [Halothece sp. PCC 7418]
MISAKSFSLALFLTPLVWTGNSLSVQAESPAPAPGVGSTQASLLTEDTKISDQEATTDDQVAQVRRRPRSVRREPVSPNYIGVGLNLGLDGDTALGNTEFAVNGRIKIAPNISFRPGAVIGENAVILVPVTYDFTAQDVTVTEESFALTPYVGGGVFFTTDDESEDDLGALVTAGLDIPVSRQFTANAGLNIGFVNDDTEFGLLLGIAYNIPSN